MIFRVKETLITFVLISLCYSNSYGSLLDSLDEFFSSNIYVCEENLVFKGSVNRLICAYKEGDQVSKPFTSISIPELKELQRCNVNLVYYSPDFDVYGPIDSEKNKKALRQLSYFVSCGMSAWVDVLGANLYPVSSSDVDIIKDLTTEKDWVDAVSSLDDVDRVKLLTLARAWDLRLDMILEKRVVDWGNFFCESTGKRVADNPVFGIWSFESDWLDRMIAGDWLELPNFFKDELIKQWNNWVYNEIATTTSEFKEKYKFLEEGESIEEGTLKLVVSENHPAIDESVQYIILDKKIRAIFEKTERFSLQREFFIHLYLNHISRLKTKFLELGSVSRDAPYFITMSAKDNANIKLTDLYFGSQNTPYVCRYLGPTDKQKNSSFDSAKNFIERDSLFKNASIIMIPHSVFIEIMPFNLGFVHFASTTHPNAIKNLGANESKIKFFQQDFTLSFGLMETNYVDGLEFVLYDTAVDTMVTNVVDGVEIVSMQKPDNSNFELKIKYIRIEREILKNNTIQTYILLDYDVSLATYIQLYISGRPIAKHKLMREFIDTPYSPKYQELDDRGAIKLNLNKGFSRLFIKNK